MLCVGISVRWLLTTHHFGPLASAHAGAVSVYTFRHSSPHLPLPTLSGSEKGKCCGYDSFPSRMNFTLERRQTTAQSTPLFVSRRLSEGMTNQEVWEDERGQDRGKRAGAGSSVAWCRMAGRVCIVRLRKSFRWRVSVNKLKQQPRSPLTTTTRFGLNI